MNENRIKKALLLAVILLALAGLCSCGKDEGKTGTDKQETGESKTETDKKEKAEGTELKTGLWNLVYSDEWSFDKEDLADKEDYAAVTLKVMDGEEVLITVKVSAEKTSPDSYRDYLKGAEIDAYEMVEKDAVKLVDIGGVKCVPSEREDARYYCGRAENANTTVKVDITGEKEDAQVQKLLDTLTFTLKDDGNVDPPWPWKGKPLAPEKSYSAMVADYTVKSEWLPFEESAIVDDIFSGRIAVASDKLWVLLDGRIYGYNMGEKLSLEQEVETEGDYEEISADSGGNLYAAGFMQPMLTISDGKIIAKNDGTDRTVMHKSGSWGVSSWPGSLLKKITLADNIASIEEWPIIDSEKVSGAMLTENHIFVQGTDKETDNIAVWSFDTLGSPQFTLGNKESGSPDSLGSVTQMIETPNGLIGLDGNMREILFWKNDGTFIGKLEDSELFGTNYPWISAAAMLPDGSILIGLTEERPDKSADEFIVFRLSGF